MASITTDNSIRGDRLIVRELCRQLRYKSKKTNEMLSLVNHGIIAVESLLEYAISRVGKLERSTRDGEDFVDGSDAKKCIINSENSRAKQRTVNVCNLQNKRGKLRIMVADTDSSEIYMFVVPYKEYRGNRAMKIIISNNTRSNSRNSRIWNQYRVYSFREFCS